MMNPTFHPGARARRLGRAALLAGAIMAGVGAMAQGAELPRPPVDAVSIYQIAAQRQPADAQALRPAVPLRGFQTDAQGSTGGIFQAGINNRAFSSAAASPGALIGAAQAGTGNLAQAAILASPGSAIAQTQIGDANAVAVGIIGGRDNVVATAQVGNGLGMAVGLVNSVGATLTYGQAGASYSGGIVILNAAPGTAITIN